MKADRKSLEHLTIELVKDAAAEATKLKKVDLLSEMNEHQKVIYDILSSALKIRSGELYRKYRTKMGVPVVDRAYRNYMRSLVQSGLVRERGKGRWKSFEITN